MRKLLIATGNKGKFAEIIATLRDLLLELVNFDTAGFPAGYEVEEPAMSYEGNAIIKAMIVGRKSGLLTLAEDSGLEVDALGGRPGVRSARYAEGDAARRKKLLEEMRDVPDEARGAQFRCGIAIYDPETEKIRTCEGLSRGRITREERGTGGFGFDPLFVSDELGGKTFAEAGIAEKNRVSHRGRALAEAREFLQKDFLKE